MRAAILLALSLIAGGASEARPAPPRTITINLCATDVTSHEWSENLWGTVLELLKKGNYPEDLKIHFSSTGEPCREAFFGCYSDATGILCNEQSLNRLLLASAWMAAHDAQRIQRFYRRMPTSQITAEVGTLDFTGALMIADALNDNDRDKVEALKRFTHVNASLETLVTEVQKGETDPNPNYTPSDSAAWIAGPIYAVASSELMALVLGHELSHAMGKCHLTAPASVERSGQFDKLADMQARGTDFIREEPETDEVDADRCALRMLEQMDAGWVEVVNSLTDPSDRSVGKSKTSYGRLIALEAYAALLTNSLSGRSAWAPGRHHPGLYQFGPQRELMAVDAEGSEGYLHPPIRLALVAMTLHERQANDEPRYKIVLCGTPARQFVAMLNIAGGLQKGNKSPEFANLFGTIVAPGVVTGWRTGVWREGIPGSYTCDQ